MWLSLLGMANAGRAENRVDANEGLSSRTSLTLNGQLYQNGLTSSVEGVETEIDSSKTEQQLNDVSGKMKAIEAR